MFPNLKQDFGRLREINPDKGDLRIFLENLFFNNGFQAVILHRMTHWLKRNNVFVAAPFFGRLTVFLTGVEIAPAVEIGPGLMISHGQGIVIGQWAKLGANVTIMQQVTLGAGSTRRLEQMPTVGDGVLIGAGASLIGGIEVGDGALVGTNAVVTEDVPPGGKATAPSAEITPASPSSPRRGGA